MLIQLHLKCDFKQCWFKYIWPLHTLKQCNVNSTTFVSFICFVQDKHCNIFPMSLLDFSLLCQTLQSFSCHSTLKLLSLTLAKLLTTMAYLSLFAHTSHHLCHPHKQHHGHHHHMKNTIQEKGHCLFLCLMVYGPSAGDFSEKSNVFGNYPC